jgi:hypothetical protein
VISVGSYRLSAVSHQPSAIGHARLSAIEEVLAELMADS